jgi:hypothetical protein
MLPGGNLFLVHAPLRLPARAAHERETPQAERRRRVRISLLGPTFYLVGTLCSLVLPPLAIAIYAAIPLYFTLISLGGLLAPSVEK